MLDMGFRDGHSPLPRELLELHPGDGLDNPCLCTNWWRGVVSLRVGSPL